MRSDDGMRLKNVGCDFWDLVENSSCILVKEWMSKPRNREKHRGCQLDQVVRVKDLLTNSEVKVECFDSGLALKRSSYSSFMCFCIMKEE